MVKTSLSIRLAQSLYTMAGKIPLWVMDPALTDALFMAIAVLLLQ